MRGTPADRLRCRGDGGIIPAHAGNTANAVLFWTGTGDHPRACGEHNGTRYICLAATGSSPRMRGTPCPVTPVMPANGIIPAHAGNTRLDYLPAMRRGGSSPRMRGTHFEISTIPRFLDSFCLFFIQFHFEYFFACRYLLALLHPRRRAPPKDTSFALDGRLTSSNPSQSVGDQSAPCTLNARCCSFLAE